MAVRTLVVTVSPLLADIVTSLLQQYRPLDLIGALQTRERLAEHLRATLPDLIVLGLVGTETDDCALPLLSLLPTPTILVLAPDGRNAWLYKMRPHRSALGEWSADALIRALATRFDAIARKEKG